MASQRSPLDSLTSLRFFAAAAIVYSHTQGTFLPASPFNHLILTTGVSFFFVLSGFILTYAYNGRKVGFNFYRSRFAKLWPLHCFVGILCILMETNWLASAPSLGMRELSFFLLLQAWIPLTGSVFCVNGVAWSISAEMFFYTLFPKLRSKNGHYYILAVAGIIAAILFALDFYAAPVGPPWNFPPEGQFASLHVALQFPLVRLLEFCVGLLAGNLYLARRIRSGTMLECLAILMLFLFAASSEPMRAQLQDYGFSHWGIWYSQCGGMLFFAFAIYIFAHQDGFFSRVLQSRTLVLLGKISFATYLVHVPVLALVIRSGIMDMAPAPVYRVAGIAAVYAASWLAWKFVEVPAQSFINSFRLKKHDMAIA